MENINIPGSTYGNNQKFTASTISVNTISDELSLSVLGDFEPLRYKIDCEKFNQEIEHFRDQWINYIPREDRANNKKVLAVTNLQGADHVTNPSVAQASHLLGRRVKELEFKYPTDVYRHCTSLQDFLAQWNDLGRTFLVKSNIGGYFVPHRDYYSMPRDSFRLIAFLNNCSAMDYDWIMDDRKLHIEMGRVYYLNTRHMHRTISWVDNSIHLILNVGMTTENVSKVINSLQHCH
jgi:hypothetical protein